jgi:large subunit ribosomal protein L13
MDSQSYKTLYVNQETATREWLVVDAKGQTLGRLASRIAYLLRGKHKTSFTPHVDCGDRVIVLNADHVRLTGSKATERAHMWYTGYPGGERFRTQRQYVEKEMGYKVIENAVRRMLPKSRLGRKQFTNLYVYNGTEHPHEAQQPKPIDLNI